MSFIIWLILFVIAVCDAKEHRIPNKLVVLLVLSGALYQWSFSSGWADWGLDLCAGALLFSIGLGFYFLRFMSPGDVKLLAGVGVYLGWGNLLHGVFWIGVSSVLIGLMYLALPPSSVTWHSEQHHHASSVMGDGVFVHRYGLHTHGKSFMPFAPVVVVGLALHHHFYG
ncbi:A24 family peptidase [Vibrio mangrovi]|uniref:Prepilin peptidase n=1 Tax=Vibrio mangrovi TaxID=474394 RepID=A0A1Y6IYK1_9VIBR|nr:prepilin peptidase [Vibrio mangrovi]MDW6002357.1 prepilin peptidase [Vibrio mangrovi]SMS02744.1 Type IV leader peptidase family protein [Vibrio mangrovi]